MEFQSKKYLVTGAASGFGKAIAEKLLEHGAKIYGLDRTEAALKELQAKHPTVEIVVVDLTDWDGVKAALKDLPPMDGLVNCAGVISFHESIMDIPAENLDFMWNVNVKGGVCVTQSVVGKMIEAGVAKASVVNFSSIAGLKSYPGYASYGAAKAAMQHMTKSMALEFGPKGVRCNIICPEFAPETNMGKQVTTFYEETLDASQYVPLRRFTEINDVVELVVFLLSDKSSFMTGAVLPLVGGSHLM